MKILLTNDDGPDSPLVAHLAEELLFLSEFEELRVVILKLNKAGLQMPLLDSEN